MKPARTLLFLLPLTLASCADLMQGARQSTINVRDDARKTAERVKTYFVLPPYEKPVKKPVAERYCYRLMQDITCYAQPVPGAETRLVAYQGSVIDNAPATNPGSLAADTSVMPVQIAQGPQLTAPIANKPMIIGDARDRAFDSRTPGDMKPIFIAPPPDVNATSDMPKEPVK